MTEVKSLAVIKQELNAFIGDKETLGQLVETAFKGLQLETAKKAMLEALMRGFTFDDFLKKNVYAVPFGSGYSLVTSIDHARKIGMRSGVVGVTEPVLTFDESGTPLTCSVTVKKQFESGLVGEFTALVYFKEYTTNRDQWNKKPVTMISKVAEMHALRKACPEELSQAYDETEFQKEHTTTKSSSFEEVDDSLVTNWREQMEQSGDLESLHTVWASVPAPVKQKLQIDLQRLLKQFEDVELPEEDTPAGDADVAPVEEKKTKSKKV